MSDERACLRARAHMCCVRVWRKASGDTVCAAPLGAICRWQVLQEHVDALLPDGGFPRPARAVGCAAAHARAFFFFRQLVSRFCVCRFFFRRRCAHACSASAVTHNLEYCSHVAPPNSMPADVSRSACFAAAVVSASAPLNVPTHKRREGLTCTTRRTSRCRRSRCWATARR